MEQLLIYVLKASALLAIFWLVYTCFLNKTTFFKGNRLYLLFGLITSIILPLVEYKNIVLVEVGSIVTNSAEETTATAMNGQDPLKAFIIVLSVLYLMGLLFFMARLCIQLLSLQHLLKKGTTTKKDSLYHVQLNEETSPFSFFKYLVYNPKSYTEEELRTILMHEKIHAKQFHSFDVIFAHLYTVALWFNPFSWLYKKEISQNLEYLTDYETTKKLERSENYQYLLLKQLKGMQYSVINPFYSSLIKKRIVMLQKQKSNKVKLVRYALVVPFLLGFMMLFSFKTVTSLKVLPETTQKTVITTDIEQDADPIYVVDGKEVSKSIIEAIDPKSINKVNVLKGESAIKKYGKKGKNGVIEITLKDKSSSSSTPDNTNGLTIREVSPSKNISVTSNNEVFNIATSDGKKPLIIVDGKEKSNDFDIESIDSNSIKSIAVIKNDQAPKKYGEKGKNGVILIATKSKKED